MFLTCALLVFAGTAAAFGHDNVYAERNAEIQIVHLIFMNHLDAGYTGLLIEILNSYFQVLFPRAIAICDGLQRGGYVETFIYTTHPWLVTMFLDCPPNLILSGIKLQCPNATQVVSFIKAVDSGCITWHAGPMNLQTENAYYPWLYEYGIEIGKRLDQKFNISRKSLVLSQRDVPGLTQAAIPLLVKKGVTAISVGVNNMTPPPAVPKLFVWQYGDDSVIGAWHPGGYPDNPGPDPLHPGGLSVNDCLVVDGLSEALCFAFRTDNTGPPESVQEVLGYYEILRAEFPNADIKASHFEKFFSAVQPIRDKLPVVRNEIGDTWIQGDASDPRRCAEYRAVTRVMAHCFDTGDCSLSDVRVWNASQFLIKVPEHTWGLSTESDAVNWSNDKFHSIQYTKPSFLRVCDSWNEQREIVYLAVEALKDHPVVNKIDHEFGQLVAKVPSLQDFIQVSDMSQKFTCSGGNIEIRFGSDGSLVDLVYYGITIASHKYPVGRFVYITYNETDFDSFGKQYNYDGATPGYDKRNLTKNVDALSQSWPIQMQSLYASKVLECEFYAMLQFTDHITHTFYGAPESTWIHYTIQPNGISIELQWFNKTSTRLPEAFFFTFSLDPKLTSQRWMMSKLGSPVDPLNVVLNGSQHQHVVDDRGVVCSGVRISSTDVPIVCPMTDAELVSVFPAPLHPIQDQITGFAFNIYNNIWETNWIFWYPYNRDDADLKARFYVDLSGVAQKHRDSVDQFSHDRL